MSWPSTEEQQAEITQIIFMNNFVCIQTRGRCFTCKRDVLEHFLNTVDKDVYKRQSYHLLIASYLYSENNHYYLY